MCIFGWGKGYVKELGILTENHICNKCSNNVNRVVIRVRTWFSFCFIPIFAYKTTYHLICPICQEETQIKRKDIKKMNDSNIIESMKNDTKKLFCVYIAYFLIISIIFAGFSSGIINI